MSYCGLGGTMTLDPVLSQLPDRVRSSQGRENLWRDILPS